jgi:hypothetical protein
MKTLAIVVAALTLAGAPAVWAQNADNPKAVTPAPAQGTEQTLTGCLASHEGTFILRTSSGEVELRGEGLIAHVGKTIRVTGTRSSEPGNKEFAVSAIAVVAPQCQA